MALFLLGQPIGLGAPGVAADTVNPVRIAQQGQTRQFDIEAQSLAPALNRFSEQSGISFAYKTGDLSGIRSPGVSGSFTSESALRRLLAGTGITYRFTDPATVTLESGTARTDGDARELGPITVEGKSESAIGPVDGYVARRSLTGSKTNTPTIEIPQSISIITRDQLDELGADTLNEALRYTPGFTGEVFGNDSRVDFLQYRGFDENGTGVYRDGLQLRSFGFAEFRPEIYGAQRVEVLRGPSSALYGASTPGGVVNIVSKRPPSDFFAEAKAEFGNFNYKAGMFDIGGPIAGSEKVQARLTGLVRDSETQIDFIDDDGQFIAPAITLKPTKDTTFTALGYYQRDRTGASNQFLPADGTLDFNPNGVIPTNRFIGETSFDTFDRDAVAAGYIFEHQFNEIWTVRQNARYDYLDTTYETAFGGGLQADQRTLNRFAFVAEGHSNSVTVDSSVQASFATGPAKHTALVGLDYQYYDVDSLQRFGSAPSIDVFNPVYGAPVPTPPITTDTTIKQNQLGIYAQEQLKLFNKLVFSLGGRHDFVYTDQTNNLSNSDSKQKDSEFSWRFGAVYLSDTGLAPYATYARSFLPIVGTDINGTAFQPETGELYEIGIKYQPEKINGSVTLSLFELRRQNVLTTDPGNPVNQVQTGEVRSRGFEAEAVASFEFGLDLIASLTLQDVVVTKSNRGDQGNTPATVPDTAAALWADYTIPDGTLGGLGFGGGVRYKGSSFGDAANTFKVNSYVLFDAAVHYEWEGLKLAVNAENIFNNRHVASCSSANACFYGTDRTVIGSIGYRW